MAGCTSASPGIPNVYLTSFYYQKVAVAPNQTWAPIEAGGNITTVFANLVNGTQFEARAGYIGLCEEERIPSGSAMVTQLGSSASSRRQPTLSS